MNFHLRTLQIKSSFSSEFIVGRELYLLYFFLSIEASFLLNEAVLLIKKKIEIYFCQTAYRPTGSSQFMITMCYSPYNLRQMSVFLTIKWSRKLIIKITVSVKLWPEMVPAGW